MTLSEMHAEIALQKLQFQDVALQPNTLQRNVVLAGHRSEIARLEKLAASKSASSAQGTPVRKKAVRANAPTV